ncbi:2-dehydro-3-deoxy-6-phosphogalactonate aldolase [Amantichitinum ursilacus]|uniref:2-dehydro-3-deoxy-6-phosphogalactonate aldolase n=1 Tax=Amantichitinum ursilacus TaxID=857265 RepID=A0A0N0GPN3_9NEIS|nr:2-dehydro-3-deoxy-6-phosphogalactonate aldolase [Amantichitinum ursilacus]KPC53901.1 2-dehydro-3-deoxy-6-phosphogalactonate aldolase [Amantichitinum ursilacus]
MSNNSPLPLIAILRGITPQETPAHIEALIDAGFGLIEIPLNSPDWHSSIALAVRQFGQRAQIGAGTVLQPAQVDQLAQLGARLIVTPNTNPAVISRAVGHQLQVYAGCATATEAFTALQAGAQALKIFPSSAFGPAYIKALKAVLPAAVPVYAVGGITPANLADYMAAGCAGAGLGGDLYRAGQSVARTAELAREFVTAYRSIQS